MTTTLPGGKCTRCGRALKTSYLIEGVPYQKEGNYIPNFPAMKGKNL